MIQEKGQVLLVHRAAGTDPKHVIRFGLATSKNGFAFERFDESVFSPSLDGFDAGCVEDPRVVKFGEYYYITYVTRIFPPGEYWLEDRARYRFPKCPEDFPVCIRENLTSTGLLITKDFESFIRAGRVTDPLVDDRDVILFPEKIAGQYVMMHRPMSWVGEEYGIEHPAIWISRSNDLLHWSDSVLMAKARYDWECKIGGNTPPIKTPHGWLTIYHGVGPDEHRRD